MCEKERANVRWGRGNRGLRECKGLKKATPGESRKQLLDY